MSYTGMDLQAFLAFLFTLLYFIEFIAYSIKVCMIIINDALSLIQNVIALAYVYIIFLHCQAAVFFMLLMETGN